MKYHLNWDALQSNGIIFNAAYTNGCFFEGAEYKPSLSFDYSAFQYSEVFDNVENYILTADDTRIIMTSEQEQEIKALAVSWVQPLGQEGNPTDEQKLEEIRFERNDLLKATDHYALADQTLTDEMRVYRQELRDMTDNMDVNNPTYPTKP